ncbi:MAG: ABC transporter ATP-binding protein [Clostridia bacterium]|jgi:ABC-type multidrug transport system fused ATPase/permease subunit|nr:ABC transporter ATP-binding protein [Clostridia bacterium]MDD3862370.1 ABC transporter ATP-binding protein [Clostridia bacterium]
MKAQKISLFTYIKRNKFMFGGYLLFTIFSYTLRLASVFLVAAFLAEITLLNFDLALNYLLVYAIILILSRIFFMIAGLFFIKMFTTATFEMKYDLVLRSFKLTSQTYSITPSGKFIDRISQDPERAIENLDDIIESLSLIINSLVAIIYIIFINLWISLIVIASFVGLVIFEIIKTKINYRNNKKLRMVSEDISSLISEIVRSEKDIKALNLEDELIEMSDKNLKKYKNACNKTYVQNETLSGIRNVFFEICLAAILIVGLIFVQNTYITIASFLFIFMNRDALNAAIYCLGNILEKASMCRLSSKRMFELFDENKFPIEQFGNAEILDCKGEIVFKDVCFYYDKDFNIDDKNKKTDLKENEIISDEKIEKRPILKNLSFKIPAGKTVAFVGKSGSGKTTILSLISKLYTVKNGAIYIDDININDLSKESLRNNISMVNQHPYIFNETIKNNLLFAKKDATEEELWNVCKEANLDEFIKDLPKKLDTVIGENGIKLSGGQRQRLAIARAFLKKSKIILFDESTSSLDNHAQNDVKNSIEKLKNHTVIIVAHRLSTIVNCDLIYFLEDGEIKDIGTFSELFERNEKFNSLFIAENI